MHARRLLALSAGVAAPAVASERDAQLWITAMAVAPVSARAEAQLDLSVRYFEDASHLGQVLVRPMVTYRVGPAVSVTGAYVYSRGDTSAGRPTHEHRALQQAQFRLARARGVELTARTRLEQRFQAGEGGTAFRIRQQLRGQASIGARVRAYAAYEVFLEASGPDWGPERGVEQLRATAGATAPLAGRLSIDLGYMSLRQFRRGGNRVADIALLSLVARY